MECCRIAAVLVSLLPVCSLSLAAQGVPDQIVRPKAGGDWERVKVLPLNTKLHVSTDHGSRRCRVLSVTDDALTCAGGGSAPGVVLQRPEVKAIKLMHTGRSVLVGAGVGGGIGAIAGGIAGRSTPCPTGQTFCLNGIGIGPGGVAAIFGVGGAVLGAAAGGLTDATRGSAIYVRP